METRQKAQALIMAGRVTLDGRPVSKPGLGVDPAGELAVKGPACPYVGRGGWKLAHALDTFGMDVTGWVCLDVGVSTGGFTDCLLQRGASRVMGVDVGRGQLHERLRTDPRVTLREGVNARFLDPSDFLDWRFDLAVIDVSFISLRLILEPVRLVLTAGRPGAEAVALVKPQFEAGRAEVGRGGVVRDPAVRARVVEELAAVAARSGFLVLGDTESPLAGADGNREHLLHLRVEPLP